LDERGELGLANADRKTGDVLRYEGTGLNLTESAKERRPSITGISRTEPLASRAPGLARGATDYDLNVVPPRLERHRAHVAFEDLRRRVSLGEGLARVGIPLGASDDVESGLLETYREPTGACEHV